MQLTHLCTVILIWAEVCAFVFVLNFMWQVSLFESVTELPYILKYLQFQNLYCIRFT